VSTLRTGEVGQTCKFTAHFLSWDEAAMKRSWTTSYNSSYMWIHGRHMTMRWAMLLNCVVTWKIF